MLRCRERVLRVVGRCRCQVVRHQEALEPTTVIADFHRRSRQDLVLHRRAELPVGWPDAPALEDLRVDWCGRQRLSERRLLPRAAFAVGRRVHVVALRDVVTVDAESASIVPGPVGRARETRPAGRIHQGVAILVVRWLQITPQVDLQRRLAIAEDIVRGAHSRADVVEAGHANRFRERDRGRPELVRTVSTLPLRRPAPGAVVAEGTLQRQSIDRPLILHVRASDTDFGLP